MENGNVELTKAPFKETQMTTDQPLKHILAYVEKRATVHNDAMNKHPYGQERDFKYIELYSQKYEAATIARYIRERTEK